MTKIRVGRVPGGLAGEVQHHLAAWAWFTMVVTDSFVVTF